MDSKPTSHGLRAALWGAEPDTLTNEAARAAAVVSAPAVSLLRALLCGLTQWMPSWLLSDVVSALWPLRLACELDFATWLQLALGSDAVPRAGLAAEQKRALHLQLVQAKSKSHFKAALKQLCGGKKTGTRGTLPGIAPANGL